MGCFDDSREDICGALSVCDVGSTDEWAQFTVDDIARFDFVECDGHDVVFASVTVACEMEFFFILLQDGLDDFFHNIIYRHVSTLLV